MKIVIETKRLILREYEEKDFSELAKIISDPYTMRFYPKPYDESGVMRWIHWNLDNYETYGFGLWAIELKDNGKFIGDCGITMQTINGKKVPECGFHIHKDYWQKGYAKEASLAVLMYAFTHFDFEYIYCYQNAENVPSRKTATSIGMKLKEEYRDCQGENTSVYWIKKQDFLRTL